MYIVQLHYEYGKSAWRQRILIPIFKGKGDIQECNNYRGIKLLSHTFKIWERVVDRRIRQCTNIHESQFGFMPGRSTTDAIFILKQTIEKHGAGQKNIRVRDIYKPRKSIRPHTQGGDLEMLKGTKCAGKVH